MSVDSAKTLNTRLPFAQYRGLLATYLGPQRRQVALLGFLLFAGIGLQLLNPQIIRQFLDAVQSGVGSGSNLALAGLAFIAIGLLQSMVNLAAVYAGENVAWRATNALRADLARHCLRLDLPFHKQHTPGELIDRIDGDAMALANFFSQFVVRILGSALLIAGVLVLLYLEDWRLGLALTAYAAATVLVLGKIQGLAAARWARERVASAAMFGYIEERYNGTEDIQGSGAEAHVMNGLYVRLRDKIRKEVSARFAGALTAAASRLMVLAGYAAGLGLAAYLYQQGAVSIGGAYVVVVYVGMLAGPLETVRGQLQDLGQARASLDRATGLFALTSVLPVQRRAALPAGALSVELDRVSFAYDDAPSNGATTDGAAPDAAASTEFALRDVSFSLPPGRVLGLLGRTGSGKSTLTSLLFRLYDPQAGALRLAGVDVRDVAPVELRAHVGMITQEVQLFQASIRDNLAFFNPQVDDDRLAGVLAELGMWEWVQSLPFGLDTRLGAGGQGMSAGEAQLLAFARVLLKDPGLVVLDEASSRLDPATERLLEQAVGRLLHGRTGIIIAHRLHTVARADDILIMDGGRVVEFGPRLALAAEPGSRFAGLLRTGLEEALA